MEIGPASAAKGTHSQAQWQEVPFRPGKSSIAKQTLHTNALTSSLVPVLSNSSSRRDAMNLNMLNPTSGNVAVHWPHDHVTNTSRLTAYGDE